MGAQQDLVDRVVDDLATDPRVRGLWLTGSFGAGSADELSDVDMFVLVLEAGLASYAAAWLDQVAPAYSPLLARRMGNAPVFHHVLEGWLRWDVVVGGPAQLGDLDGDAVIELLNRDGVRPSSLADLPPESGTVRAMTEEFLRVLGLLPVVVGRGELVTAASGASMLRQMLTTLLRYRAEGPRMSGALHLNRVLPADELSDVDMFVLVHEAALPSYAAAWLDQVAPAYKPLLARRLGHAPVFQHVLEGWLRWDVVVGGPAQVGDLDGEAVIELVNRDAVRLSSLTGLAPESATVLSMTEEFLRVLGLLPVVVGRGELVTAASGASMLRQMLTTLLRYRVEGPRMSGALHLSRVLPPDELAALGALPPVYADRDAVIRAHVSAAAMFLPVARDLLGADHPQALEDACWAHLHDRLAVTRPA